MFQPAINLARDGFVVTEDFSKAMDSTVQYYHNYFLVEDPVWAEDFAPNGTRVGAGDKITRRRYAATLEAIASQGSDAFYKGPIANATVQALRKRNGTMTMVDLEDYRIVSRVPVEIDFRGFKVRACGVPASGAVVLSAMKILEAYDDNGKDKDLSVHRMDEAIRFGYGKRASFGDPDFTHDMAKLEAGMLNRTFAANTKARISDKHTLNVSDYDPEGFESHEDHGTSHVATADASGMAVSLTTTINLFFGSGVMVPETGVIINDEMNDFSLPNISNVFGYFPSPANYIKPGKRSMSSIAPIIIDSANGTLFAVMGASGGSRIITTVLQNALNVLERGMTVHEAVQQPRLHDQLLPNRVMFEWSFDNETVDSMKRRGHNVTWGPAGSSAQAISIVNGRFEAAGEPRQHDSAGLTA